jgi:hypothetical protein
MRSKRERPQTPAREIHTPALGRPAAILAAWTCLALLLLTGCGSSRVQRGLTRAGYVASADAVCRFEQAKLAFITARARRLGRAASSPAIIRQQVAQSQLATSRLEALAQPPGDTRAITQWLTARTVAATVAVDVAEAPARGERRAVAGVQHELIAARARARALAFAYGSRVCGEID